MMRYKAIVSLSLALVFAGSLITACAKHPEREHTTSTAATESAKPIKKLVVEDTEVGEGKAAKAGDKVTVHYTGTLYPSGQKFDSSHDHGRPFEFELGAGQVIQGWDEGVVGMKKGGKRTLIIPSDKAYGDAGYPPVIPQKATLKFDIELLEVQ